MATVTVPAEFFRAELRVYGNWRTAFARELLQNATDANPSSINVAFADVDGHGQVTFSDDGHGMTRDVLENVFFALGRSTKNGPDSIGGFGRARIILCFAQTRYTIRTGNLLVEGSGSEYTITEVPEYRSGCEFVITLIDSDTKRIRYEFENVLRTCTLTIPVTLDGRPAPKRALPARANRIMRDDLGHPWGRVYVGGGVGQILVRVHGLTMFNRYLSTNDDVILELTPSRSREVLTASRDQLHTSFGDQLDKFVNDLSQNRKAALRPSAAPLDLRVGGGGFMATDSESVVLTPNSEGQPGDTDGERPADGTRVPVTPANAAAYANARPVTAAEFGELDLGLSTPSTPRLGFDVFLMADDSDARVRKLARAWDPTSWTENTGRRRRALLLSWKAAVAYAMDVFVTANPSLGRVLWTVGWTFDTESLAIHRQVGDGHVLALNPVTEAGAARYHLSDRAARQQLLAIAAHEVVHVTAAGHDERFASLLTDLFGKLDAVTADRLMREARAAA